MLDLVLDVDGVEDRRILGGFGSDADDFVVAAVVRASDRVLVGDGAENRRIPDGFGSDVADYVVAAVVWVNW